jgi:hypothetical protein
VAKPFTFFARETGANTAHIYTLLQYIAGENYEYLLSWLRQKMLYPKKKTEIVPIFTGKQGTGKSTFGEVICRAMFGEDNVLVTHSFNGASRFNVDQTDKLVISIEEKSQDDKYNATSILKSLSTAKQIRKESKGIDPFYQDSYTEYVLTANDIVPLKFDTPDQRRFMVMKTNPDFVRKKRGQRETETSILADEIFTAIYGETRNREVVGQPLYEQRDVISQFKYELMKNKNLPSAKDFIETEAFKGMYNIPRTVEMVEIEALIQSIAPFIRDSLIHGKIVENIYIENEYGEKETIKLEEITPYTDAFLFVAKRGNNPNRIAINQMLLFREERYDKPYAHASIAKALADLHDWLQNECSLKILNTSEKPTNGGFRNCASKFRLSPAIWFVLTEDAPFHTYQKIELKIPSAIKPKEYIYQRYNHNYQPDDNGCLEVLNTLIPRTDRKAENCTRMNNFLLEADEAPRHVKLKEKTLLETCGGSIRAEELYKDRLDIQRAEGQRLMNEGIVRRLVYSGGKSIHMIVEVQDGPSNKEERRWLDAYLKANLSQRLNFDIQTSDVARLTRAPITYERIAIIDDVKVIGTQQLLAENHNVYDLKWRPIYNQWLNTKRSHYEEGAKRKLLPTKKIYRDGAHALLDGSFWTDSQWDGQRNEIFFVAYRLVRNMGYSYDEVWDSIAEDVQEYYKKKEIPYWLSRKNGSLIQAIESELEGEDDA